MAFEIPNRNTQRGKTGRSTLAAVAFVLLTACQHRGNVVTPAVKPLLEAVYASGFVVSQDEYQVFSQAEGYLVEKNVSAGQMVRRGDPLFVIDAGQQAARNRLAHEQYGIARVNAGDDSPVLQELAAARETARKKLQFDSINFVRYSNLLRARATTQAEYDRARLAFESAANDYSLQKSRYAKTVNQLYLDLQNARSQLEIAGDENGRYTLRSRVDGMVFKTMKEAGELVRRNEAIAVIGQAHHFYLQLNVDELDIQRIHAGQEVLVRIDAYPDTVFRAQVDKIYPMVNPQQQSFRVDAIFKDRLPGQFSGLALEANIIIRRKDKALVIPKTALLPGDSVRVSTAAGAKNVKVTTGIRTIDEVEIVYGLDPADQLIVQK